MKIHPLQKNKVFSGLNGDSSTLDKIKIYLIQIKWISIYSKTNKVSSRLNESSSTPEKQSFFWVK